MNSTNYKSLLIILIAIFTIMSCHRFSDNQNKKNYLERKKLVYATRDETENDCFLKNEYSSSEDWMIATVYFPEYSYKLDNKSNINNIIRNITELHRKCTQKIAIIAHTSNTEENKIGLNEALLLSLNRASYIKNLLQKNKIADNYIKIYFCSNNLNTYKENSKKAQQYNQKVDIVLLNKKEDNFPCLSNIS